jgi:hypothetical protein
MTGIVRKSRKSGILVTFTVTMALLAAMALTVLGLGIADQAVAVYDSSSWLWSSKAGELGRVNGITGAVDTRAKVKDSQGHDIQITQNDRFLIIRDLTSGTISSLDLTTLQVASTMDSAPGFGVNLALHDDVAFVIDSVQGVVRQVDPLTLNPTGQPLRFPPGLRSGGFDGEGRLWLAVPSEGTVVAVKPGKKGIDPTVSKTVPATDPRHDISLSVLDKGIAVLDQTAAALVTIRDDIVKSIKLPIRKPGAVADRTSGADIPVTVSDDRHIYVVNKDSVREFEVPAEQGRALRPAVAWAGWFYVADTIGDLVYVLDGSGNLVDRLQIKGGAGGLQFDVRENHLFINPPNGNNATVVDGKHRPKDVPKFPSGVPGGDPLPPPQNPPKPPLPPPPVPAAPGVPTVVTAVAGNASATVRWGPAKDNLSPITKYVIQGAPAPVEVGGNQRTAVIGGLVNGNTYTFRVYAVNAKGAGPTKTSNPVIPTREVPDPPDKVTAREDKDGTVRVTWVAANGQGHKITKYVVMAVSGGADSGTGPMETVIGESTSLELLLQDGKLAYGTQYGFMVAAVNDINATSKESTVSNTVVPYNKPAAVTNLKAATDTGKAGTVNVSWAAAVDNGRPITKYVVTANGKRQSDVTGTSVVLTGFAEGAAVRVEVHAVNLAGDGPVASDTATTIKRPALTGGTTSAQPFSINIPFAVNDGGSPTTCWVDGAVSGNGSCHGYNLGGLRPGTGYGFTVHAKNAVGEVTWGGSVRTADLGGTVCPDCTSTIEIKTQPCYQNPNGGGTGPGCVDANVPNSAHIVDARAGSRYTALCKKSTQTISSAGYQYNRRSNVWIYVNVAGRQGWIPWAWFKLDGDNGSMNSLPSC